MKNHEEEGDEEKDGENWWRIKMRESMGREIEKSFIECFYVGETILIYEMCWQAAYICFDLHVISTKLELFTITCNVIKPFGNIAKIRPFHPSYHDHQSEKVKRIKCI